MDVRSTAVGRGVISFEDFHRRRRAPLLAYARSLVGGDGAEDACQEAWIRAWTTWGTARPDRLDVWMQTLVQRCSDDRLGRSPAAEPLRDDEALSVRSFEEDAVAAMEVADMWALLRSLPGPLREVLFLRGVLDLSYAEIAEVQRVPMGTVMSRLYEARRRARNRLSNSRKIEYFPSSSARPA